MRIHFLPKTIIYENVPDPIGIDALDLAVAIARHISLTSSPSQPATVQKLAEANFAAGKPYWTVHAMGDGQTFSIHSLAGGSDLCVTFPRPSAETSSHPVERGGG